MLEFFEYDSATTNPEKTPNERAQISGGTISFPIQSSPQRALHLISKFLPKHRPPLSKPVMEPRIRHSI